MRALIVVLALLAGCGRGGTALDTWTLDAEGSVHETITLPAPYLNDLPLHALSYTLHRPIAIAAGWRGQPLVLEIDCFHGALAASVDGHALDESGDPDVGSRRFVIPAALTGGSTLTLALELRRDLASMLPVATVPRIGTDDELGPRGAQIAAFNRYAAVAAIMVSLFLGLLYGALYVFGRGKESLVIALWSLMQATAPLVQLGIPLQILGVYSGVFVAFGTVFSLAVYLAFIHLAFRLGPVSRRWWIAFALVSVPGTILIIAGSLPGVVVSWAALNLVMVVANLYGISRVVRVALGAGELRRDARLVGVFNAITIVLLFAELVVLFTGHQAFGGVHPVPIGVALQAIAQAIVVSRHHAANQRTIEDANRELQRQVAERSRELSEALSRLSAEGVPITSDRIVDQRYRVIGKLGAGGMGTVFEVQRLEDGKRFAMKTLRGRRGTDLMMRFAREAQVAAELAHPNLVPVVDVGFADGALYLVMPLIDGGSLEGQRSKFGDPKWARPILRQIAAGLAALHARDIIHRDLKPANVLLAGGVARIADFGLASLTRPPAADADAKRQSSSNLIALARTETGLNNRGSSPQLTRQGDVFGTPAYMAPELESGVHAPKPSSDVFAFGLIACELMTGAKAFAEPPLVSRIAGKNIAAPDVTRVPAELRDIVRRCLDLDPSARPTAAELVAALAA